MKIKITPGFWRYFFRSKTTGEMLSTPIYVSTQEKQTTLNIHVPKHFENNFDVIIHLERVR